MLLKLLYLFITILTLKLCRHFVFFQFTVAKEGGAKLGNKLYLPAVIRHIFNKFGSSSLYKGRYISAHTDR